MSPQRTTPLFLFLLMAALQAAQGEDIQSSAMSYRIRTSWDDRPLDHDPVTVTLVGRGEEGVEIKVDAPFFGEPGNPGGEPGKPFDKLWEYEVVEVFFADGNVDKPKYVEVELCPWGQHLVLLLDGVKNAVRTLLPIKFTASINGNRWNGNAIIPAEYFPPKVNRFNAYAIHDVTNATGDPRRYEALFPVPSGKFENADFHRLHYFKPLNFELLQPGNNEASISNAWPSSMLKEVQSIQIKVSEKTLGGEDSRSQATYAAVGVVDGENAMLNISMSALFINKGSDVPQGSMDEPLTDKDLDSYETVRVQIANGEGKILELVFSPYGQYDIKLYSAPYNLISRGHRANVTITQPDPIKWTAVASIPLALLPADISAGNVVAVYKMGTIQYETSYQLHNAGIAIPDVMVVTNFPSLTGTFPSGVNDAYSDLWDERN